MNVLRWHKTLGIIFLVMLVLGVYLTYAIFTQKFTDFREVTLETSKIGLQLPQRADVKIRGMIVGEVREIDVTEDGARLTLGLYADKLEDIPADVTARSSPRRCSARRRSTSSRRRTAPTSRSPRARSSTRTSSRRRSRRSSPTSSRLLTAVQPATST